MLLIVDDSAQIKIVQKITYTYVQNKIVRGAVDSYAQTNDYAESDFRWRK